MQMQGGPKGRWPVAQPVARIVLSSPTISSGRRVATGCSESLHEVAIFGVSSCAAPKRCGRHGRVRDLGPWATQPQMPSTEI